MEKTVYENPWFKVLKNGNWHRIEEVNPNKGAVILIVKDKKDIVFVKNKRYAVGNKVLLELPRGYGDNGESSVEAAKRETQEETGYQLPVCSFTKVGSIHPNSGILSSEIDVFVVLTSENPVFKIDTEEIDEVLTIPISSIAQKIKNGEITDGFTLSALTLYYSYISSN